MLVRVVTFVQKLKRSQKKQSIFKQKKEEKEGLKGKNSETTEKSIRFQNHA